MADTREAILARLFEVVAAIPGIRFAYRNNTDLTDDQMPAALVLDGEEEASNAEDMAHPPNSPTTVLMKPEIEIVEQSDNIGSDLTTFRSELMKLVLYDAALKQLTGSNGAIRYAGCETTFGWQQQQYGVLQMRFTFKYSLKPDDL